MLKRMAMASSLGSKIRSALLPILLSSSAAFGGKQYLVLYSKYQRLKENDDLLRQMEESGGYFVIPPSFFAKPRPPVPSALSSYIISKVTCDDAVPAPADRA